MIICPKCGFIKNVTVAMKSAVKTGGTFICFCKNCNAQLSITYKDIFNEDAPTYNKRKNGQVVTYVKIKYRDYQYRRFYGLCVICGEPSIDSKELCPACKAKGLLPDTKGVKGSR